MHRGTSVIRRLRSEAKRGGQAEVASYSLLFFFLVTFSSLQIRRAHFLCTLDASRGDKYEHITTFEDVHQIASGAIQISGTFTIQEELKERLDGTFTTQYHISKFS